ncbi:carbohydrate kinase family protein [Candidatus Nomurabacteria bacterium]|nr:carbohydrate kinase family protein [Candidatus Nomurabacteria bacterium]
MEEDANTSKTIIVGPSVAFESYWEINSENIPSHYSKIKADNYQTEIGGSSANLIAALINQGYHPDLVQFVGPDMQGDFYSHILNDVPTRSGIRTTTIPCLKRTNASNIIREKNGDKVSEHVYEFKGAIVTSIFMENRDVIKSAFKGFEWKIASGIRDSNEEKLFLKDNFGSDSNNILIPKIDLIQNEQFSSVVSMMDVISMNETEFKSSKMHIKDYHELGVSLLIITNSDKGGRFSFLGNSEQYEAYDNHYSEIYETGAGDWFTASLCVSLLNQNIKKIRETGFENVKQAVLYASRIAGIKVGIQGASNGPSHD